jgi:hypothetical protein
MCTTLLIQFRYPHQGLTSLFAEKCAGPDLNRTEKCSLTPFAARSSKGSNPHSALSAHEFVRGEVRGTGFEPADPYGTAS